MGSGGKNMELKKISMNKIILTKGKKVFEEGEVFALAKSIALCGMLSPITVRQIPLSDRYEIIMGNKRFYAYRLLGFKEITALIIKADPSFSRAVLNELKALRVSVKVFFVDCNDVKSVLSVEIFSCFTETRASTQTDVSKPDAKPLNDIDILKILFILYAYNIPL